MTGTTIPALFPGGTRRARIGYAMRASRAFATQPHEALERTFEKVAEWRDDRGAPYRYPVTRDYQRRAHELIGHQWPCPEASGFGAVWMEVIRELRSRRLRVGRGAFGGWDDGDSRLVGLAWCLARHLQPTHIIETGVARGLTTRALLEALDRNGSGRLWSVDLPPLLEHSLTSERAIAVPADGRERWTLVAGSSRRVLPPLIAELGQVDLFIHDSMHTTRNLRFELEQVWPALSPGGVMLIDDVEKNGATAAFLRDHPEAASMVCRSHDGSVLIGLVAKQSGER